MSFGKNRSEVWKHFLLENKGKSTYKCKHCSVELKFHSSTSSFLYHLEHKHKIYLTKVISEKSKNIQPSIATVASKIIGANQKINKYQNIFETNKIKI